MAILKVSFISELVHTNWSFSVIIIGFIGVVDMFTRPLRTRETRIPCLHDLKCPLSYFEGTTVEAHKFYF